MTIADVKQIISTLLKNGGFHVDDIEERFESLTDTTVLNIISDDARSLIGREGETVRALNHIVHRMADQRFDGEEGSFPQFSLDVDDYYQKRIQDLKNKVTILANRVRSFGSAQAMDPMNPYERLIVHNLVSEITDVDSESEGVGRDRHIVLKPKTSA